MHRTAHISTFARLSCLVVLASITNFAQITHAEDAESVNVYSARKENLIRPLLDRFSEQTGIQVKLVTAKADILLTRIATEGSSSPVDLLITVDAGRLYRAQQQELLRCLTEAQAKLLRQRIPAVYRDPEHCWFGLSVRSRVVIANKEKINLADVPDYESLAKPRWKNNICIRSSSNVYNQSLVASMIAAHGPEQTLSWLKGFVANFARPPQGGDRDQILAAGAGLCDIAVANTYYFALMLNSSQPEQRKAAQKMQIIFPNQSNRGAHVNISGAGISRHAPHFENALRLLEYLSSEEAQVWYGKVNYEYPVASNVPMADTLKQLGAFKKDTVNLHRIGALGMEALKLMNQAKWK